MYNTSYKLDLRYYSVTVSSSVKYKVLGIRYRV